MADALGMIEWKGIARALEAVDGMLKSSPVELIVASPVCPGKFIALISGELSAVKNSVNVGIATDP
ncbi:MAG: BMC domain-containing protein, partial [Clostridia bacterium]|nr:BMC domain-containing protein [Clostridia bacterium]